jgi:hypothetical protein
MSENISNQAKPTCPDHGVEMEPYRFATDPETSLFQAVLGLPAHRCPVAECDIVKRARHDHGYCHLDQYGNLRPV